MDLQFCRSNLLSRRAEKIAVNVLQFQTEGKDYVNFSSSAPPVGIGAKNEERNSERLLSSGNGSKNVPPELLLDGFQYLKELHLDGCDSLIHLLKIHGQQIIMFPKLNGYASLLKLEDLRIACLDDKEEHIDLVGADSITTLCSHQLLIGYINKLEILEVIECGKLRNYKNEAEQKVSDDDESEASDGGKLAGIPPMQSYYQNGGFRTKKLKKPQYLEYEEENIIGLLKEFDKNGDGRLSMRQLIEIFLSWFSGFNARMNHAYIKDDEIDALAKYAMKWGYKIV
ncbi:hypothetical protein H5410_043138 [Solanum commersonii]|uniref:EF-hand domain-containing protein n=1 Tax=Solanum commersonii TaxID=4109 RepID=A0A9J5XZF8_SOLCO|nr:hypothetical protein H5410_043138 [Solanum commersonii]